MPSGEIYYCLISSLPLAFPFGSPCRIAVLRQARQVEWRAAPREDKLKSKTSFKPFPCLHKILLTKFSSAKMLSLFQRLPLGGKLRREAVVRGANCFLSKSFQSSGATCSPFPCFPLRGEWRVAPREDKLKSKTFYMPSPCLKKFSKLHFLRQKCSATSWLPLGGKLSTKLTDEGQFQIRYNFL